MNRVIQSRHLLQKPMKPPTIENRRVPYWQLRKKSLCARRERERCSPWPLGSVLSNYGAVAGLAGREPGHKRQFFGGTMARFISGLFPNRAEAERAVDALEDLGYAQDDISVVMQPATRERDSRAPDLERTGAEDVH